LLVDRKTGDAVATLHEFTGEPGKPLTTTLDLTVQEAAEAALSPVGKPAALVAVQLSTGQIVAAATGLSWGQNLVRRALSTDRSGGNHRSALDAGAPRSGEVSGAVTVQGKDFENQDTFALGICLSTDFAQSCNTAFVGLRERLSATPCRRLRPNSGSVASGRSASRLSGSVPEPPGDVDKAAEMIAQGKVLMSRSRWQAWRRRWQRGVPPALPARRRSAPHSRGSGRRHRCRRRRKLRSLMREVVERDRASATRSPRDRVPTAPRNLRGPAAADPCVVDRLPRRYRLRSVAPGRRDWRKERRTGRGSLPELASCVLRLR
jgi:hypothetical protein